MDKNIEKIINDIVWWIPFKKLRNNTRNLLLYIIKKIEKEENIKKCDYNKQIIYHDMNRIIEFRKEIYNDNNFLDKYLSLINNLDDESSCLVSKILSKINNFKNIDDYLYVEKEEYSRILKIENENNSRIIKLNDNIFVYGKYILPMNYFEVGIFYEKYGMNYIYDLNKLENLDIIDAGGFIGDSAIFLSYYTNKNVYSFEALPKNYNLILETIRLNNRNNIVPINMALGNENKSISIFSDGSVRCDFELTMEENATYNVKNDVYMTSLDKFVDDNNINVGLIKVDLEGFEQPFLLGALETIKKYKPILLLSIYHNYNDFFNIKTMIEQLDLNYTFKIIKSEVACAITTTLLICQSSPVQSSRGNM